MNFVKMADAASDRALNNHNTIRQLMEIPDVKTFIAFLDGYWGGWSLCVIGNDGRPLPMDDLSVMVDFLRGVADRDIDGTMRVYTCFEGRQPRLYLLHTGMDYPSSFYDMVNHPLDKWMELTQKWATDMVTSIIRQLDRAGFETYGYTHIFTDNLAFTPEMMEMWLDGGQKTD